MVAHVVGLAPAAEHGLDLNASPAPVATYPSFEQWQVDQDVRQLQARIAPWQDANQSTHPFETSASREPRWQAHASHAAPPRPHARAPRHATRSAIVPRITVWLGLAAFTFGAGLLVWSFVEDRLELWTVGVPLVIGGQIALLLGLALQLERVWQNSRDAVRKLQLVDSQLHRLERSTTLMCATNGSGAFYAHMADQASPHVLVANLKGQLDLLAQSMAKRRG
jgi:hypothetical protein